MEAGTSTIVDRGYAGLPIPFGWFAVAMSDEIASGEIRTLRYFGSEFVVWRGEDGRMQFRWERIPEMPDELKEVVKEQNEGKLPEELA